ncbi:hypothetical protein [Methanobrevibacter sp.]|uniref:hypothetical protein n=1 Tax=Methanobrevibacter sp. TaxID=66852 RepID=UPI00388FB397
MACHYHPERESTDVCAICGKQICKECGLEIAGKIYCKDCLQQIIGIETENQTQEEPVQESAYNIYAPPEEAPAAPKEPIVQEYHGAIDDSPYNIRDSIEYSGGPDSSLLREERPVQVATEYPKEEIASQVAAEGDGFIYPDHSYEPQPTSARLDLEDKYEKYLDDLYFDENEIPLNEQLAKDEEQYGSLTRKPYTPREAPAPEPRRPKRAETPEEMEARIRAEILREQGIEPRNIKNEKSIHNLNYQEEKEPMGIVDILLTVVLVIVILIVVYYLIYLFILHNTYPTFMDAVFGLRNPQNVINNIKL